MKSEVFSLTRLADDPGPAALSSWERLAAVMALVAVASTAHPETYRVGPGPERPYKTLQEVASLLNPGDLVEVDGNATYPGDATFRRPGAEGRPIVIRGIPVDGRRPVLSGGSNTVHFRTDTIGSGADHYVMEGFEITGGTRRCVFHQAADLTLRDVVVHDCPKQGILGADWGSGSLTIEHSEVYGCGGGSYDHQIYIGMDEDNYPDGVFRLQFSHIHDGNGGNNVKSRASRNEIYYNRIEGAYYHELELIGAECCGEDVVREDSDVVGNLIIKKPPPFGPHPDFYAVRVGGDGTGQTWGRYRFVHNTFVVGAAAVFRIFHGVESVEMHNNVFYRYGGEHVDLTRTVEAVWRDGEQIAGSGNWVTDSSTNIPASWTDTVSGVDPGFTNAAADDYRPADGSPLVDGGVSPVAGPPDHPFPNPLFPPAFHPPGPPGLFGTPNARPADALLDVGAYEAEEALSELRAADGSLTEGDAGDTDADFDVTLLPAASTTARVRYETLDATATAGIDYVAADGTVTFAPGETSRTVTVQIIGDTLDEADETFYLVLSDPTNATVADAQGLGTIIDNDEPTATLSINDVSLVEGDSGSTSAGLTVTLSGTTGQAVTVDFTTVDGSAEAGDDYVATTGDLTFPLGTTIRTISIDVVGDTVVEPDEGFFVELSAPAGALLARGQGQATILNDDSGPMPPPPPPDFNGDGRSDLLWRHDGGALYVWFMNGANRVGATDLTTSGLPDASWQVRGIGDFNRDGRVDILWGHDTGSLYVWFMDGTTHTGGSYLSPAGASSTEWRVVGVSDLNGDGQPDLVWRHVGGSLYVWFMDGTSLASGAYLTPGFVEPTWRIRGIGDFSGDGRPDILWHHEGGSLYLWLMNGTSMTSGTYLTPGIVTDTDWQIARVADANGDGRADILWRHRAAGALYMWFMTGAEMTSGSYLTPSSASAGWHVVPR